MEAPLDRHAPERYFWSVSTAIGIVLQVVAVVLLFFASTVFFDAVHWLLHRMLASRWAVLRALAWPHEIHHRWIDRKLEVNWEFQSANVWCHLCLEYATHLCFSALLLLVLPTRLVLGVVGIQTVVFLFLLSQRGLDLNHRPRPIVEVAPSTFFCPTAYHALHHVYPDAYFSSYVKVVDVLLGTALDLRERRVALLGDGAFAHALHGLLREAGALDVVDLDEHADTARSDVDVLVLCAPDTDLAARIEPYLQASGDRQVPPEVWAVRTTATDPIARHYYRDRRVFFRPIILSEETLGDERALAHATRIAFACIRRSAHLPRTRLFGHTGRAFRATRPLRPAGAPVVRRRAASAEAA